MLYYVCSAQNAANKICPVRQIARSANGTERNTMNIYTITTTTTAKTLTGETVTIPAGTVIRTSTECPPAIPAQPRDNAAAAVKADFPLHVFGVTGEQAHSTETLAALHKTACKKYANTTFFAVVAPDFSAYALYTRFPSALLKFSHDSKTGKPCIRTTDYTLTAWHKAAAEAVAVIAISEDTRQTVTTAAYAHGLDTMRKLSTVSGWRGRYAEAAVAICEGVDPLQAVIHAAFDCTDTRLQPDIATRGGIEVKYKNASIVTLHG